VHSEPAPAYRVNPRLLPEISDLIHQCLAKDPDQRPATTEALALIEQLCETYRIRLGPQRVSRFLATPKEYPRQEEKELYELFCERGREFVRKKKLVHSIKNFAHAKLFGRLGQDDERLLRRLQQSATVRRVLTWASGIVLVLTVGYYGGTAYVKSRPKPSRPLAVRRPVAPAVEVPDTSTAAADTLSDTTTGDSVALESGELVEAPAADTLLATAVPAPASSSDVPLQRVSTAHRANGTSGYLRVKTNPPWTRIYVDGVYFGVFPRLSLVTVAGGSHVVTLKNPRCRDFVDTVAVQPGDTVVREIVMVPLAE
jgi:hypothetical protein